MSGRAVVVQDADSYQNLLDRVALFESLAGIRKSIAEFEQGQGMPLDEAFTQLRKKHDLPD
ncbi:hypothetical protein [Laspinema palackyanum]|uniref:hypothetical protein n=1 Tax=Laspinema palackyanum TaxID=3231601 RepID=UPI00345DFBED|nr:hypothetical protein [Laspinema sp. D2c]